ncbi:tryptophan-rich sensory protein [Herbivorax sp. ANBcel31]|uniref:tryptophan-rich sensory protein n=1 Tax=Herbivorax sp. ANBcel31 TaxID=3069754 RepID=UPI0027B5CBCB|nr:tryptophan-rich sensory protein [Herbivorax sp. ANBcel31]MDQ2084976.1 tryptophan-rich sensory protein [Herbivorax sp. ANBcel31]
MNDNSVSLFTKVHTTVSFLVMVVVNFLANTIPFNGVTSGEVSDSYENLFAPAGITFSIWGVIYLGLAVYTIYQYDFIKKKDSFNKNLIEKIGVYFTITSIANTAWVFAWHYQSIGLSLILIAVILICLVIINNYLKKSKLAFKENFYVKLPFSIYFGWITIATIANIIVFLVSLGWDATSNWIWTVLILIVAFLISGLTMLRYQDFAYGLVIIWAYIGILIRHTSLEGFSGEYPLIITTLIVSMVLLLIANVYILAANKKGVRLE